MCRKLGKVSSPSQVVDNLRSLCVSTFCAAEEWDFLSSYKSPETT